jgi:hypothetical protein
MQKGCEVCLSEDRFPHMAEARVTLVVVQQEVQEGSGNCLCMVTYHLD